MLAMGPLPPHPNKLGTVHYDRFYSVVCPTILLVTAEVTVFWGVFGNLQGIGHARENNRAAQSIIYCPFNFVQASKCLIPNLFEFATSNMNVDSKMV